MKKTNKNLTLGDLIMAVSSHSRNSRETVAAVADLRRQHGIVAMVGDGINDAPALSTASVGIALAAHGGGIAAEAADVVLLTDRLNRVPEAVSIGRRTMRIARQSILVGLGLSGLAMVGAALGYLPPAAGALVQEAIDVGVILNALRALSDRPARRPDAEAARLGEWIRTEHRTLWPRVERLRWLAARAIEAQVAPRRVGLLARRDAAPSP